MNHNDIHDMIHRTPCEPTPEFCRSILDLIQALNDKDQAPAPTPLDIIPTLDRLIATATTHHDASHDSRTIRHWNVLIRHLRHARARAETIPYPTE